MSEQRHWWTLEAYTPEGAVNPIGVTASDDNATSILRTFAIAFPTPNESVNLNLFDHGQTRLVLRGVERDQAGRVLHVLLVGVRDE